ncbi:MAG TPA: zinc-binding dehydrogenase, partial [Acidimicrobiia bacterium]|nr:zinc-binding dehydrogenase [Acidimicrobiia bacterium]
MRAWLLDAIDGPSSLRLADIGEPRPGEGEAIVNLKVVGLNHLDVWVTHGLPAPPSFPHILGADGAGIVGEVGAGVTEWVRGDEVIINPSISCGDCGPCRRGDSVFCRSFTILGERLPGTMVERIAVPARNLLRKPETIDWPVAGTCGLATGTAYRMLSRARLTAGDTVLVVGVGGGVSSAATLLAIAQGANVYVTSRSPEKIAWAVEHGAKGGFDSAGKFAQELRMAHGMGANVVVENVGQATWDQSLRSLEPGGRMVLCGATAGNRVELALPVLWFKQFELIGSTMSNPHEFAQALAMVADGSVPIPIDRIF